MIGTYGGDLAYILFKGGGAEAVGQKLKKDIEGLLQVGNSHGLGIQWIWSFL